MKYSKALMRISLESIMLNERSHEHIIRYHFRVSKSIEKENRLVGCLECGRKMGRSTESRVSFGGNENVLKLDYDGCTAL